MLAVACAGKNCAEDFVPATATAPSIARERKAAVLCNRFFVHSSVSTGALAAVAEEAVFRPRTTRSPLRESDFAKRGFCWSRPCEKDSRAQRKRKRADVIINIIQPENRRLDAPWLDFGLQRTRLLH